MSIPPHLGWALTIPWLVEVWAFYWAPRKGKYSGIISKRFSRYGYRTMWIDFVLIGVFAPLCFIHNSTGAAWTIVFLMVAVAIDWWTENDRPKRWLKKVKNLAKRFTLKPIPKPAINLG